MFHTHSHSVAFHLSYNTKFMSILLFDKGCYSGLEDQICKENNDGSAGDMMFWSRRCITIADICQSKELTSHNGTYCFNSTSTEYVAVRSVIRRVLASEEYY